MTRDFTTMVLHLPRGRAEVVTRRGHLSVLDAADLAQKGGGKLHAVRHMRLPTPQGKGAPQLVRIVPVR